METEIKKVNSLEELNESFGRVISVRNVLEGRDAKYICEGRDSTESKEIYSFLSFHPQYPQDRRIGDWKVEESRISFKQNGAIEITSHDSKTYSPMEKGFNERLKLIQEAIK